MSPSPPLSWLTLQSFIAHGGLLVGILFLTWRKISVPSRDRTGRRGSWLHGHARLRSPSFNYLFGTNYFYLCEKPLEISLLEFVGPWPIYILVADFPGFHPFLAALAPISRAEKVTIQHLLSMQSGIGDLFGERHGMATPKEKIRSISDYLPLFADRPLEFEPGPATGNQWPLRSARRDHRARQIRAWLPR